MTCPGTLVLTHQKSSEQLLEPVVKPTPFLKWAGGKGQLLEQMDPYFPEDFGRYHEPFLGGGAVFFHLSPRKAVLSDSNPELIHVYQMVKNCPIELMASLDVHRTRSMEESYFYEVRGICPDKLSSASRAARLVFLNKTCFNGLYRVNSKGEFNVPYGGYRHPTLYVGENLQLASAALQGAALHVEDFRRACKRAVKGDLVYLDPPYQPLSRTSAFTDYTREGFGRRDQEDLAAIYRALDNRGCKVMLSNSSTPWLRELYREYHQITLKAKRAINCKGTGRGAIDELLVMNY